MFSDEYINLFATTHVVINFYSVEVIIEMNVCTLHYVISVDKERWLQHTVIDYRGSLQILLTKVDILE